MASFIDLTEEVSPKNEDAKQSNHNNGTILIDDSSSSTGSDSESVSQKAEDCLMLTPEKSFRLFSSQPVGSSPVVSGYETRERLLSFSLSPPSSLPSRLSSSQPPQSAKEQSNVPASKMLKKKTSLKNKTKPKPKIKCCCFAEIPENFARFFEKENQEAINLLRVVLDEAMVKFNLTKSPKYPDCIRWLFEKTEIVDDEIVETIKESSWLMLQMNGEEYMMRLAAYKKDKDHRDSLINYLSHFKDKTSSKNVILIVSNLSQCLRLERAKEAKKYRQAFRDKFEGTCNRGLIDSADSNSSNDLPEVSFNELGDLRLSIELDLNYKYSGWKVHINFAESKEDVVTAIEKYSRSISKIPSKQTAALHGIDWAINMDKAKAYDPTKSDEDRTKLWLAQLQQFPLVTLPIAKAIASEYPSPFALIDQYKALSNEEGESLLAELYVQRSLKRQIGMNISKRVYCFATCKEPNIHIGMS